MSRTKAALLGTISSQVYAIITLLVSLFSAPLILAQLQSEIYGLSIIIFQIAAYLGMFDFGLTAGVQRFLSGTREDSEEARTRIQKIISTAFVVYTILGIVSALCGFLFAPYASAIFNIPQSFDQQVKSVIRIVSVIIGMQFLFRTISGIFFAHQRQLLSNTLSFALSLSNMLLILLFVHMGHQLWSFVYAQAFVFLISALLNVYFFRKHYAYFKLDLKKFDVLLLKDMFSFGIFIFLVGIAVQVVFFTDRIIVGSIISLTAVSIYSFSSKIPELLSQVLWKITDNSFPGLVEVSKEGPAGLRDVHDKLMRITLAFSTTGFWVFLIGAYPFISLWVGSEYYAGFTFTALIAYLYLIQHTFIHVSSICLNGAGIANKIAYMSLIEAAINLSISIALARSFGLTGVVAGTIVAGLLTSFWFIPYLIAQYTATSMRAYYINVIKPVLLCSMFDLTAFALLYNSFQRLDNWFDFSLAIIGFALLCTLPVFFINKSLFLEIKGKLFIRKSVVHAIDTKG